MKTLLKGTILLTIGGFICKVIGALYRIPLANILGANGLGYYQMVFPLYSFALVFISGGIPLAMSRFISISRARNNKDQIAGTFAFGFFISLLIGIFFCVLFVVFAKNIASLQGDILISPGYYIIGITLIFSAILCPFRGLFQGYEMMNPTFISQIIEQVFKLLFGILFSYLLLPYGIQYAFLGALLGICVSEVLSVLYILFHFIYFNKKHKLITRKHKYYCDRKEITKYALPITISSLIIPLVATVVSLIGVNLFVSNGLSRDLATSVFGIQTGMVNSIISFPTVISTALATALIPALSYSLEKNHSSDFFQTSKSCFKIIWILTVPCSLGIYVLAPKIIEIAFSNAVQNELFQVAVDMLRLSSLSIVFIALLQITTVIIQVTKKQWLAFYSLCTFAISNIILLLIFNRIIGIYSIALSSLFAYAIASVMNLIFVSNHIAIKMPLKSLLVPLASSIIMTLICISIDYMLQDINIFISTAINVLISASFYFACLFISKVINFEDLKKSIAVKLNK